jgi:hypothetical protein
VVLFKAIQKRSPAIGWAYLIDPLKQKNESFEWACGLPAIIKAIPSQHLSVCLTVLFSQIIFKTPDYR